MTSYLLAGPAVEPVSLAEAKAFLRLDDTAEDGLVTTLIGAARLHVEGVTGRALVAQSWRLVLDAWPEGEAVRVPVAPLLSLTAVTAIDADGASHALSLGQFRTEPERCCCPAWWWDCRGCRRDTGSRSTMSPATDGGECRARGPAAGGAGARGALVRTSRRGDRRRIRGDRAERARPHADALSAGAAVSAVIPPIGTLTDRVQLKRRESLAEAGGGHARLYVPLANAWARVRSLSGREGTDADGRTVAISHSVVMRFRSDLGRATASSIAGAISRSSARQTSTGARPIWGAPAAKPA